MSEALSRIVSMFDLAVLVPLDRLSGSQLAAAITDNQAELMRASCRMLELACAWADLHTGEPGEYSPLIERAKFYGGAGTPAISEFCVAEFGVLHGAGAMTAQMLIADALDLRHRLPRLWAQVRAGQVHAWQARKVAEMTRALSWDACVEIDAQLCGALGLLPWGRFRRILAAAVLDADPALAAERQGQARRLRDVWATDSEDGLKTIIARATSGDAVWFMATVNRLADILARDGDTDTLELRRSKAIGILAHPARALQLLSSHRGDPIPVADEPEDQSEVDDASLDTDPPTSAQTRAGRPRVVLHYHLSDAAVRSGHGMVRPEHGEPITLDELREWLADTGCTITVRPVVDPADVAAVDAYEIPLWMRDAVRLRNLADVFPYGSCTTATMDLDHTIPWRPVDEGGPPGQTRPGNLGPLTRAHHRAVTHGRWRRRQPDPGQYLFRTPTGTVYLVTNQGTQRLGSTDFAQAVWHAAEPTQTEEEAA
jgi:hypothetical protein